MNSDPTRSPAGLSSWRTPLAILGAAIVLRLPSLASRPLWYDEAFAVLFAGRGPEAMVYGTLSSSGGIAADVHPLLYYTLLWGWERLVGASPLAVRFLSLVLGTGVVAAGYATARLWLGPRPAAAAGGLLAISPFQVHYAQEVRMYGLLTFLLLAAAWLYGVGRSRRQVWPWIGLGVVMAAAQYTHHLAAFFLIALALTPILERRRGLLGRAALSVAVALTLYLPWAVFVPAQIARVSDSYWIEHPGFADLLRTLIHMFADRPLPTWPAWGLAAALFLSLLGLTTTGWTISLGLRHGWPGAPAAAWFAGLAIAPLALMFAVSQARPVYLDRALLPSAAALALAAGWVLAAPQAQSVAKVMVAIAFLGGAALGLYGLYSYRGFPYAPFSELNDVLRSASSTGEVILHTNKLSALPAWYYGPDLPHRYLADPPGSRTDTLARPTQVALGFLAQENIQTAVAGSSGVWLVFFQREREEYASQGIDELPSVTWLQDHYFAGQELRFLDLRVLHFDRGAEVP